MLQTSLKDKLRPTLKEVILRTTQKRKRLKVNKKTLKKKKY